MQVQGLRKELQELKKVYALNFRTIDELLRSNIHTLTDEELFRLIQIDHPELKSLEDLTDDILEQMIRGEYSEPVAN
jgi:hypothetical protein